jgi:PAS domain S-box-containing protein
MSVNVPEEMSLSETPISCEDEPIRIPGSIQRHGFLLLLDGRGERIVAASQNTEEFLNVPLPLILGTQIENVLDREVLGALRVILESDEATGLQIYLGSFQVRGNFYSVVTHRVGHERIVEFERLDQLVNPEMTNQVFTNFVSKLNTLCDEQDLCDALAQQMKQLTGFNRILLYRFDEAGHGRVLSEVTDGALPSYLGLRFPASDIPKQARELYVLNTVRIIPNATYEPAPLVGMAQREVQTLDLSMSLLRSVSPVHLRYMQNMGTLSSMSVSIICEGKLWGLVSGHHAEPREIPYLVRSACDLLTKLVATQLSGLRTSSSLKKMVHFHAVQRRVLTQMAADNDYLAAMADRLEDVLEITGAKGVALLLNGECKTFGVCPTQSDIQKLADWMDSRPDLEVFESKELQCEISWASEFVEFASGLLALRISHVRQSYLMWFRPEVVRTVEWAGVPPTPEEKKQFLNPRRSFDTWAELVRGRSKSWSQMEVESATEFRAALMTISLKRAEEAAHLSEARFLQLTHALPHPVWSAEDDGQLTYVNQQWLEHGLLDHGLWFEQSAIFPEDQQRCREAWNAALISGTPVELEIRICSADNTERSNLLRAAPYRDINGNRRGWVGTCTDLTDRRQRETALRMTEKLALTGRMTSVIAHEINNPLEAMMNLLFLLDEHVTENETARGYISLANLELQRISAITKQTLIWAKESGEKPTYGTVGDLFENVLRLFAGKIRNHEATVTITGGADAKLYACIGQIVQIMANLVANAIQAVPVGGSIWLSAESHGETMELIVRDQGHGMSEEIIRNLFQPFYSTRGDLGNGLGLYISREMAERNNGSILVQSEQGKGTEIRVRLPAIAP